MSEPMIDIRPMTNADAEDLALLGAEASLTALEGLPSGFAGLLVAQGILDGYIYQFDGAHDLAALGRIVVEAGGQVTDRRRNHQRYDRPVNGGVDLKTDGSTASSSSVGAPSPLTAGPARSSPAGAAGCAARLADRLAGCSDGWAR